MVAGMVNEAAMILDEGIASCAADLDLAMIMGTGFPPFRGGLMRWADTVGASRIHERLAELEEAHGPRFAPAPALAELAGSGGSFTAA